MSPVAHADLNQPCVCGRLFADHSQLPPHRGLGEGRLCSAFQRPADPYGKPGLDVADPSEVWKGVAEERRQHGGYVQELFEHGIVHERRRMP